MKECIEDGPAQVTNEMKCRVNSLVTIGDMTPLLILLGKLLGLAYIFSPLMCSCMGSNAFGNPVCIHVQMRTDEAEYQP